MAILMQLPGIAAAFVASCVVTSFADWYFFGVLFHRRYLTTPGVWKSYRNKTDELVSIGIAQAIFAVSSLVFILVCSHQGWVSARDSITAAVTFWVMLPLPIIVANAVFIPMDRLIVVSHCLGWLARLVITAFFVSLFL